MCTRSVPRVMQLDTWMNSAWWLRFRLIHHAYWPLFPWHVWHLSFKFCYHILSLILLLLCCLTVTCKRKLNILAVSQWYMDSRTFTWCVRPLHMHRQIIISHNLVTEIKKKLTRSSFGKHVAFHRDQTSKITVCISILLQTEERSPSVRWNPISLWYSAGGYVQG